VSGLFIDLPTSGVHGLNEQVGVKELYDSKQYLYRLIKQLPHRVNSVSSDNRRPDWGQRRRIRAIQAACLLRLRRLAAQGPTGFHGKV
jgi:hypothetical protein